MLFRAFVYNPEIDGNKIYSANNQLIGLLKLDKQTDITCDDIGGRLEDNIVIVDLNEDEYAIPLMIGNRKTYSKDYNDYDFTMDCIDIKTIKACENFNNHNMMLYEVVSKFEKQYEYFLDHCYSVLDYIHEYITSNKYDEEIKLNLISNLLDIIDMYENDDREIDKDKIDDYTTNNLYHTYRKEIVNSILNQLNH